jgi:predicted aspartyl protease
VQRRRRVLSAFLLLLFGCVEAQSQGHLARRLLTVPVEINNIIGSFLIDTGANCTIIDSVFAQPLGLKPSGVASLERNYSTEQSITVTADRVRFGPKLWSNVPLVALDLSMLSRIQGISIAGVLGTDLLATMTLKLSFSSGKARVITDIGDGGALVALKKVRNRYFVPVTIGPSTFEMLLDSGTNVTALSNSAWRTLPASSKQNGLIEGVQSSGSPPGSLIACIPALHVGDVALGEIILRDHPLRVIMPSQSGSFADTAFAGILGGDILEHFEVILDLQHSSMYLKPDAEFRPDPYEFVTVGIQFFKPNANEFSVAAVWKDSPAKATGVVVGDRILSVNGHSSAGLDLETFANQLHAAAGTPVVMEVERAAGKFTLQMKTRQLVCESTH